MFLPIGSNIPRRQPPYATYAWAAVCAFVFFFITQIELLKFAQSEAGLKTADLWSFRWAVLPQTANDLWNFFSYQFIHGSFGHLLANVWYLLIFGAILEAALGWRLFLSIGLLGGAIAVIPEIFIQTNQDMPIVGASGSVAVMMGAATAMYPRSRVRLLFLLIPLPNTPSSFFFPLRYLVYFWLLMQISGLASQLWVEASPIAYATHLSGFGLGLFVGLLFGQKDRNFFDVDLSGKDLQRFYSSLQKIEEDKDSAVSELQSLVDEHPWMHRFQLQVYDLAIRYRLQCLAESVWKNLFPVLVGLGRKKELLRCWDDFAEAFEDLPPHSFQQQVLLKRLLPPDRLEFSFPENDGELRRDEVK